MAEIIENRYPRIVTTNAQNNKNLLVVDPNQNPVDAGKIIVVDEDGKATPTTVYVWTGGKF